jgi:hypothetical protein
VTRRGRSSLVACAAVFGSVFACASASAAAPLHVVTSFSPASTVLYGDPVTARVEVDYDPATVDPATIRVSPTFTPYVVTSSPVVARPRRGVLTVSFPLLCVTEGCLPTNGSRRLALRPVTVSASSGSSPVRATAVWPALQVRSRLTASDLSGKVVFRVPARPPAPGYRVAPGKLAALLIAAAVVCGLAGLLLVLRGLTRHRRGASSRTRSRLELAIAYVRDSTGRSPADRRRALSLLSEAMENGEGDLAAMAAETAWAEAPPTPPAAASLADRAAGRLEDRP